MSFAKSNLIKELADSYPNFLRKDLVRLLDITLNEMTNALKRGEKVSIVGFGNFSVSERKATTGRNPRTGESIQIPASKRPKFSVGKALKEAVNV